MKALTRVKWNPGEWAAFRTAFQDYLPQLKKPMSFGAFANKVQGKAHIKPQRRRKLAPKHLIQAANSDLAHMWFDKFPGTRRAKKYPGEPKQKQYVFEYGVQEIRNAAPPPVEVIIGIGKFTFTWEEARMIHNELSRILPVNRL